MKQTITQLLTNVEARTHAQISTRLSRELSAGSPWWNEEK